MSMVVDDLQDNQSATIETRVAELINQAILESDGSQKVKYLYQVQELALNHGVLDNFLEEILGFQNDRSPNVKKFVIGFIEAACKKDGQIFPKSIVNLSLLLNEFNNEVVKRSIQAASQLYKTLIAWISTKVNKHYVQATQSASAANDNVSQNRYLNFGDNLDDVVEQTWQVWLQIKSHICNLLDTTNNDGIRTHCVKFMECVVQLQTKPDKYTDEDFEFNIHDALLLPASISTGPTTSSSKNDTSSSSSSSVFTDEQKAMLLDEAKQVFEQMIVFHGTSHISSVNLMATMQSLVVLARQRSQMFMSKVIQALEALYANLPPTLATSQVHSVRKYLKLQLIILLKHPLAVMTPKFQLQITQLLGDIGTTQSEIAKIFNELKKKGLKFDIVVNDSSKRIKLEKIDKTDNTDTGDDIDYDLESGSQVSQKTADTAIDITAEDILSTLQNVELASELVLISLKNMPEVMPPHFVASFAPVAVAGTTAHIKHLARLLAAQLTAAGLGKGVDEMVNQLASQGDMSKASDSTSLNLAPQIFEKLKQDRIHKIATVVSRSINQEQKRNETQVQKKIKLQQLGKPVVAVKPKQLNLNEVTKEIDDKIKEQMVVDSVRRILKDEKKVFIAPAQLEVKKKVLSTLASEFHKTECTSIIRDYIFDDLRNRHEICHAIIRRNYEVGHARATLRKEDPNQNASSLNQFKECFHSYLDEALRRPEIKDRDFILPKLYAECPMLTDYSIKFLEDLIVNQKVPCGLTILTQLLETRADVLVEEHKSLLHSLNDMLNNTGGSKNSETANQQQQTQHHQPPPSSPPEEQQQQSQLHQQQTTA